MTPEVYKCGDLVMIRITGDCPDGFKVSEAQLSPTAAQEFINEILDVIDNIAVPVIGIGFAS